MAAPHLTVRMRGQPGHPCDSVATTFTLAGAGGRCCCACCGGCTTPRSAAAGATAGGSAGLVSEMTRRLGTGHRPYAPATAPAARTAAAYSAGISGADLRLRPSPPKRGCMVPGTSEGGAPVQLMDGPDTGCFSDMPLVGSVTGPASCVPPPCRSGERSAAASAERMRPRSFFTCWIRSMLDCRVNLRGEVIGLAAATGACCAPLAAAVVATAPGASPTTTVASEACTAALPSTGMPGSVTGSMTHGCSAALSPLCRFRLERCLGMAAAAAGVVLLDAGLDCSGVLHLPLSLMRPACVCAAADRNGDSSTGCSGCWPVCGSCSGVMRGRASMQLMNPASPAATAIWPMRDVPSRCCCCCCCDACVCSASC
mmetsp:Transcript_35909/g.90681  ORF Transcript_35909/g.90681 Transcript_35909/m.90681 type:complete len:370 (-) Transcript_35909:1324-2433(-)